MNKDKKEKTITLVGGGVMSLTLAALINEILPNLQVNILERLSACGLESSDALNNAGTGHAGYCELNYTPADKTGNINIDRALEINQNFEASLIFWAYLNKKYPFFNTKKFIKKTPHISFVSGGKNISFLKKRFAILKKQPLFKEMIFTENPKIIEKWSSLLIHGRSEQENIAATKIDHGTDVNFGELTKQLLRVLKKNKNFKLYLDSETEDIKQTEDHKFKITFKNLKAGNKNILSSDHIFLGTGGRAIAMLQKMRLVEAKGYAGFPISGRWLVCDKVNLTKQHNAKVYTQVMDGAPPMSIPHLDLRVINNKRLLLFGPFAGFNLKLLKFGTFWDFPGSIKANNILPMLLVLFKNLSLLVYLIKQSFMNHHLRINELKNFFPLASPSDWRLLNAGQRVQIIKNCPFEGSKLEFGTEVIYTKNKKLAALIGASPGASVSVASMANVFENFFSKKDYQRLKKIIPSIGIDLNKHPTTLKKIRTETYRSLGLW